MNVSHKRFTCVVLLSFAGFLSGCRNDQASPLDASSLNYAVDTLRTLQSLRKVNDYPLYVMTFYGDYGFSQNIRLQESTAPAQETSCSDSAEDPWRCTGFVAYGNPAAPVFGRNFDWRHRAGLLLFTDPPEGYASVSMVDIFYCGYSSDPDLSTVAMRENLLGAPMIPFDGMNEMGVAVGMMAVPFAQPPSDPSKRRLSDLAVIRLVLDYAESTRDAVNLMQEYNIDMNEVPLHYFVADRTGESAVIEFVANRMVVHYNEAATFQISTNFIQYEVQPNLTGRCWRYDLTHSILSGNGGKITVDGACSLLGSVSQNNTMWSIVYGLASGEILVAPGRRYDSVFRSALTLRGK